MLILTSFFFFVINFDKLYIKKYYFPFFWADSFTLHKNKETNKTNKSKTEKTKTASDKEEPRERESEEKEDKEDDLVTIDIVRSLASSPFTRSVSQIPFLLSLSRSDFLNVICGFSLVDSMFISCFLCYFVVGFVVFLDL